jgi:ABC-type Fe3+-hydroxamate transport system substrate-binding protein
MLTWGAPPIVIGGGSFLSQLVELAGAHNLFADLAAPSATVSLEAIAARDPDLLLFIGGGEPALLGRPEWRAVSAVEAGRFRVIDGDAYGWPSFRSLDLIGPLSDALHPVRP